MANQAKKQVTPAEWALRLTLWIYAVVSIPLYLWFLHHAADQWADYLPEGDNLRFWLPIVVPGAAFSFTLLAAVSWWYTVFHTQEFLAGRRGGWFLIVFVAALSLAAGIIAAQVRDVTAVVPTTTLTTIGMTRLWFLPPAVSPQLLDTPRSKKTPTDPS
ncbi:hypothetical protein OG568_50465 (plasmid) [Streptomyces sp. NBC_01450]|uniref:hypothetical protein n=1 Tax=Streptomyces sp. NBC_01450 TaxID=2903871 RepID=UPI002E366C87|nr:hypothetical protein [Streptomyces sp. NBC_01450]